jgi:uncharacterized protein
METPNARLADIAWDSLPHSEKFRALLDRFVAMERCLVAYSGGVDSTLALVAGTLALGPERCLGVIARSETLTDEEYDQALALAREHGLAVRAIEYSELENEAYVANPIDRCYFCKGELLDRLAPLAADLGIAAIVDGNNADDVGDWRPGMKASAERNVLSPLRETGLGKQEIRDLARALGLSNWDKPSNPCLASRVAYGLRIDKEKLAQIAAGEAFLRGMGFSPARVRHHGDVARIEVAPEQIDRLLAPAARQAIVRRLRELGFRHVAMDLLGYRTGSLNEGLVPKAQGAIGDAITENRSEK